jgi:hypothetical protein
MEFSGLLQLLRLVCNLYAHIYLTAEIQEGFNEVQSCIIFLLFLHLSELDTCGLFNSDGSYWSWIVKEVLYKSKLICMPCSSHELNNSKTLYDLMQDPPNQKHILHNFQIHLCSASTTKTAPLLALTFP